MSTTPHEIPTHLAVEDRAILGLSVRQVMVLLAGVGLAYGVWMGWGQLAAPPRGLCAALCCTATAAFALARPLGRGLADWLFVLARYARAPKAATWRPGGGEPPDGSASRARWVDLAPRRAWGGAHR